MCVCLPTISLDHFETVHLKVIPIHPSMSECCLLRMSEETVILIRILLAKRIPYAGTTRTDHWSKYRRLPSDFLTFFFARYIDQTRAPSTIRELDLFIDLSLSKSLSFCFGYMIILLSGVQVCA